MNDESKPKINCYSEGEAGFMAGSQALRGRLLNPFLKFLTHGHVSPNQLTLFSLLAGLAFCPLFAWISKPWAFVMLLLHVLLDGLDGPLARFQERASSRGSFTDTTADQLVVTFTTITLIATHYAGIWSGGLYVFFYSMVVIFAMVRAALAIPYSWLVRPRFIVYLWMPVEVYFWRGSLDYILWLFIVLLGAKMLTGFIRIRRVI